MCGRYVLATPVPVIADYFAATFEPALAEHYRPSWNVPPTRQVLAVAEHDEGTRILSTYRWGLVPAWAKGLSFGANTINARAESVATKPSFRSAFRARRCIVVADGYYEWKTTPGEVRQPYYFTRADGQLLAFAGLWESWKGPADEPGVETEVLTCAIVTTEAGEDVEAIHTRMPVILEPGGAWEQWLDPGQHDRDALESLLLPAPGGTLDKQRVASAVGNVKNDGPELIESLPISPGLF